MRTWHRWISLFLFLPMAFIAVTGLLSQAADLWPESAVEVVPRAEAHEGEERAAAEPPAVPAPQKVAAAFTCPEGWSCRPAPKDDGSFKSLKGWFHHLHSGEEFGPVGIAISILAGIGLLFFSVSGIWMYAQMWLVRRKREAKDRWFWR